MKVYADIPKRCVAAPAIIRIVGKAMTVECLRPVPVNTKHPSLSVWNSKATMWGQG